MASAYLLTCAVTYIFQEKFIFNPDKLEEEYRFRQGTEVEIQVDPEIYLNSIFIDQPNDKGVILYLHGNRGSNRRCLRQAQIYVNLGYDLLMPDYRGYGKSDGAIQSQEQLYQDIQKVYDYLSKDYGESNIILLGYSLGSGMASYIAAHNHPKSLHLVAPYISMTYMKNLFAFFLPDFLLKYTLDNYSHLQATRCPITLYHAPNDELIPYNCSLELKKISNDIKLITLDGAGHRGSIFHPKVKSHIQ